VPGDEQKKAVGMVMEHLRHRLIGAAFDATGMGWTVAEDMGRKFGLRETEDGSGLVWAIKFSVDWYRINMPPLKAAFEDAVLSLIKSDDHVTDLRAVKEMRGIPRVPDTRTGQKDKRRHGDHAIGLALAYFASRMRWSEYGYRPVPTKTEHLQTDGRLNMRPNHDDDRRRRGQFDGPLGARIRGKI
jgi:phage FluMu gp28-like protein